MKRPNHRKLNPPPLKCFELQQVSLYKKQIEMRTEGDTFSMCQKGRIHSGNIYNLRTHCVLDTAEGAVGVKQFKMRNRIPSQRFLDKWTVHEENGTL